MEQNGKIYTVTEIAEKLGVSSATVLRLIDRGELEALRLGSGGHWRIYDHHLQRFLEKNTVSRVESA